MNVIFKRSCLLFLSLAVWLSACSSSSGTLSRAPIGFVELSNVSRPLTVVVDDQNELEVPAQRKPATLQIAPGKHRVRIWSDGTLIVDRVVLVGDQQTLQIQIP